MNRRALVPVVSLQIPLAEAAKAHVEVMEPSAGECSSLNLIWFRKPVVKSLCWLHLVTATPNPRQTGAPFGNASTLEEPKKLKALESSEGGSFEGKSGRRRRRHGHGAPGGPAVYGGPDGPGPGPDAWFCWAEFSSVNFIFF
eukprot:g28133.t1